LRPICCIHGPFLQLEWWRHGCELGDAVSQEYLQVDLVLQERLPGWLGESRRPHGRLAQSPSRGLWCAGGFIETHVADVANGQVGLQVLASRCCCRLVRRCLCVDLRPGRLQLALVAGVQLCQRWRSRAPCVVHSISPS
jgi:hypothetical protein